MTGIKSSFSNTTITSDSNTIIKKGNNSINTIISSSNSNSRKLKNSSSGKNKRASLVTATNNKLNIVGSNTGNNKINNFCWENNFEKDNGEKRRRLRLENQLKSAESKIKKKATMKSSANAKTRENNINPNNNNEILPWLRTSTPNSSSQNSSFNITENNNNNNENCAIGTKIFEDSAADGDDEDSCRDFLRKCSLSTISSGSSSISWGENNAENEYTKKLSELWRQIEDVCSNGGERPEEMSDIIYNECLEWRRAFPNDDQNSLNFYGAQEEDNKDRYDQSESFSRPKSLSLMVNYSDGISLPATPNLSPDSRLTDCSTPNPNTSSDFVAAWLSECKINNNEDDEEEEEEEDNTPTTASFLTKNLFLNNNINDNIDNSHNELNICLPLNTFESNQNQHTIASIIEEEPSNNFFAVLANNNNNDSSEKNQYSNCESSNNNIIRNNSSSILFPNNNGQIGKINLTPRIVRTNSYKIRTNSYPIPGVNNFNFFNNKNEDYYHQQRDFYRSNSERVRSAFRKQSDSESSQILGNSNNNFGNWSRHSPSSSKSITNYMEDSVFKEENSSSSIYSSYFTKLQQDHENSGSRRDSQILNRPNFLPINQEIGNNSFCQNKNSNNIDVNETFTEKGEEQNLDEDGKPMTPFLFWLLDKVSV